MIYDSSIRYLSIPVHAEIMPHERVAIEAYIAGADERTAEALRKELTRRISCEKCGGDSGPLHTVLDGNGNDEHWCEGCYTEATCDLCREHISKRGGGQYTEYTPLNRTYRITEMVCMECNIDGSADVF